MTNTVLLSVDGPIATITLNDPAKHNRLDPAGLKLLREAVETADADPAVRVTVITGTGDKTFCSGYDLGSIPAGERKDEGGDNTFEVVMDRIETMRMPTLCALNGGVYGGATDLALACDFRLGVKGMRFFMPAARFGLHYYPSGLRRYTQKVSRASPSAPSCCRRIFTTPSSWRLGISTGWWSAQSSRTRWPRRRTAGRPRAAVDVGHEARHRAIRTGGTRHGVDPPDAEGLCHVRGSQGGVGGPRRTAHPDLQGPLKAGAGT